MPNMGVPRRQLSMREKLWMLARHTFTSLSTIVLATALLWGVARPHAQTFINETVKEQNKQQLEGIENRLRTLEGKMQKMEGALADQGLRQTRVETVLQNLEEGQREQRADIKLILRSVRN